MAEGTGSSRRGDEGRGALGAGLGSQARRGEPFPLPSHPSPRPRRLRRAGERLRGKQ